MRGPTHDGSSAAASAELIRDLARICHRLDLDGLGRGRPGDQQLAVQAPDGEEVDCPRGDSHRHPQRDGRPADAKPTDTLDRPLHLPGGSSRTPLVTRDRRTGAGERRRPTSRSPAPHSYASSSSAANTPSRVSCSNSAPIFPRRASRSVSSVKPEMSTNASEPSMARWGVVTAVAQPLDQHARDVRLQQLVGVRLFTNRPDVAHHSVTRASRPELQAGRRKRP